MKRNILLVANGDIDFDLQVIDAAARTAHGVRRASTRSRPSQILRRKLDDLEAVIVDLDEHTQALSIVEALGCSENKPPVIVLTNAKMAPAAYRHGAAVCLIKPFTAGELASVISNVCLHAHPFGPGHPVEAISIATPKASLREPPE
jgi:DNA-binding NtrC family response regulator